MKVRATKDGFYNYMRRKTGAVFHLAPVKGRDRIMVKDPDTGNDIFSGEYGPERVIPVEEQFSRRWMEKCDDDAPAMKERIPAEPVVIEDGKKRGKSVI